MMNVINQTILFINKMKLTDDPTENIILKDREYNNNNNNANIKKKTRLKLIRLV